MGPNTKLRIVVLTQITCTLLPFWAYTVGSALKTVISLWQRHQQWMLWCLTKKNSLNKKHTSKISRVRMAHIFYIVALLCFASCVVENTETAQRFKDLHLQQDSLPWLEETQDKQVRCLYFP